MIVLTFRKWQKWAFHYSILTKKSLQVSRKQERENNWQNSTIYLNEGTVLHRVVECGQDHERDDQ